MSESVPRAAAPAQAEAWNGYEGRHWADHQAQWDAINAEFNDPLLDAAGIRPGDQVLDIGCGNGAVSRLAARRAAPGRVLAVDLSGPMLRRARETARAEGLENIDFVQADAQLHPLPRDRFAAAVSRFGVMFFADPVAAFRNVAGALRPGGRLAFVCGGEPLRNDWVALVGGLLPPGAAAPAAPLSPTEPGMFSLADPERTRSTLTAAGFSGITVDRAEALPRWGADAEAAADFMLGSGPGRHLTSGLDPEALATARKSLVGKLAAHQGADGVRLRTSAWLVKAVRREA
ncbi:class I SAM-dependent methyltransferase [Phaeacidiphilus oryzae]|uniref:class I SAM-dependent methyltransferase n=1 Tax=Phaeacidiphilus oryzae TaxID=348818 RepID=UPI00056D4211|nr:class I SAM-dependent methyltransferase [Phaeacidiphilus oryzae]